MAEQSEEGLSCCDVVGHGFCKCEPQDVQDFAWLLRLSEQEAWCGGRAPHFAVLLTPHLACDCALVREAQLGRLHVLRLNISEDA